MADHDGYFIERLTASQLATFHQLLGVFAQAFEEPDTYNQARPDDDYLCRLLQRDTFFALTASHQGQVIGGLAAYELIKFEQPRSEIYIYDLAVVSTHRRQGVATALIAELQDIAARQGAWVIFVQADADDEVPIALYDKLGVREQVLHFDIPVKDLRSSRSD